MPIPVILYGIYKVEMFLWDLYDTYNRITGPCGGDELKKELAYQLIGMLSPTGKQGTKQLVKGLSKTRIFRHYGYAKDAEKFKGGLRRKSYATHGKGRPMKGKTAQEKLDLPRSKPPDAYYKVKVGTEVPVKGPTAVEPYKHGHKGGGVEYYFPEGTPPGSVSGPFSID